MTKKPRMIFDLPDDERDVLERVRVKLGLRSHAEALRFLIRQADPAREPDPYALAGQRAIKALAEQGVSSDKMSSGGIILPKPEPAPKFTTRLKGEWKAP
jgi:hypothetical protein